jgi:hypothetical protein
MKRLIDEAVLLGCALLLLAVTLAGFVYAAKWAKGEAHQEQMEQDEPWTG